jgi:hypothetical protein
MVTIDPQPDGAEVWQRKFDGKTFHSHLSKGKGRSQHLIVERFGPFRFAMAMVIENGCLYYVPRRWSVFHIPLPKPLIPSGTSFEAEQNGKFHFDVDITAPFIGRIVRYQGWLTPHE